MATDGMVRFLCPKCDMKLMNRTPQSEVDCPGCGQRIIVPFPLSATANSTVLGKLDSGPSDSFRAVEAAASREVPVAQADDAYEEDRRPSRRRPQRRGFECQFCGSTGEPLTRKEMDPLGWVIFAVCLVLFPLFMVCWLGFFLKSTHEVCYDCGRKGMKIDGPKIDFS
jgi:DNA-directed RNA polymerase subunit RPC12/RpoP